MRGALAFATVLLMLCPTGVAPPGQNASNGLSQACDTAQSTRPCEHLGLIYDTNVEAGEVRTYSNGDYTSKDTVHVNGTMVVHNATVSFASTSGGFIVYAGGVLSITDSTLQEGAEGSAFVLDARPDSTFTLVGSSVLGGDGVILATDTADVHDDTLANISVALRNVNVSVVIHHVAFVNNTVSVNNTEGAPTLHNNTFSGGSVCVRDWYSDPTIVHNTFRGCHVGIYHHRSESILSYNDMEDHAVPPGSGILVEDTMSPTIEGNNIRNYANGIVIRNARAYVRDNAVHNNLHDGIRVENNSAPMDITGNEVHSNGGHGIFLSGASNVSVSGNDVHDNALSGITVHANAGPVQVDGNTIGLNGGDGIHLAAAQSVPVFLNTVADNAGDGIEAEGGSGLVIDWNFVSGSGFRGIAVSGLTSSHVQRNWVNDTWAQAIKVSGSPDIEVQRNFVARANYGIWVESSPGAYLYYNDVEDANDAGVMVLSDDVQLFGDEVRDSGRGFVFFQAERALGDYLYATGNLNAGFHIDDGGSHDLRNVNASGNLGDGFLFTGATAGQSELRHPRATGNGGDGLEVADGDHVFVDEGWYEDNGGAGARNLGNATLVTEFAWWGSANGPTHADNPDGDGDEAVGNVDYSPYAETPPGPWSPPSFAFDG